MAMLAMLGHDACGARIYGLFQRDTQTFGFSLAGWNSSGKQTGEQLPLKVQGRFVYMAKHRFEAYFESKRLACVCAWLGVQPMKICTDSEPDIARHSQT